MLCSSSTPTCLELTISVLPAGYLHLDLRPRLSNLDIYRFILLTTFKSQASQLGLRLNFTYGRTTIRSRSHRTELISSDLTFLEVIPDYFAYKSKLLLILLLIHHLFRFRCASSQLRLQW